MKNCFTDPDRVTLLECLFSFTKNEKYKYIKAKRNDADLKHII